MTVESACAAVGIARGAGVQEAAAKRNAGASRGRRILFDMDLQFRTSKPALQCAACGGGFNVVIDLLSNDTMFDSMNKRQRRTLEAIFTKPVPQDIRWVEIELSLIHI